MTRGILRTEILEENMTRAEQFETCLDQEKQFQFTCAHLSQSRWARRTDFSALDNLVTVQNCLQHNRFG